MRRQTAEMRAGFTVMEGWNEARYRLADEHLLESRERRLSAATVRAQHAEAAGAFARIVRRTAASGSSRDKAAARLILDSNAHYANSVRAVDGEVDRYRRAARNKLAALDRTQAMILWSTPLAAFIGLIGFSCLFASCQAYENRVETGRVDDVRRLELAALSDDLTMLGNQRAFQETVDRMVAEPRSDGQALKLALVEIDAGTAGDARHGRHVDETVLGVVGTVLRDEFSTAAFRTGGDEFAVLLGNSTIAQARQRMDAARAKIETASGATVSIGIAERLADVPDSETLIERADTALDRAKDGGRNVVIVYEPARIIT